MTKYSNHIRNILVVAAHSDDEVLGCGATLLRHQEYGDQINLVFLTNGVGARGSEVGSGRRSAAAKKVAKELGAVSLHQLNFPDNELDSIPLLDVVKEIEKISRELNPDIIYTHFANDLNVDHRVCSAAVSTAFRPLQDRKFTRLYGFEVLSSTEWAIGAQFNPSHYVDITGYLEAKKSLMKIYEDEVRDFPHPRSLNNIEALAKFRGATSGFHAAEAFVTMHSRWGKN